MCHVTFAYSLLTSELQNLAHHLKIAETLKEIAVKKGATPAQLSIAWVSALGHPASWFFVSGPFVHHTNESAERR
jgi:aryl-alcohol dehydrogenase-like predicted oxidoreductase